jgi:hypothetical protein
MGSGFGVDVGAMDVDAGESGREVGETGVGVREVQEVRSRLRLKNEAKSLFIKSFR